MKFVLGSSSPRRSELLTFLGVPFIIEASQYDERAIRESEDVLEYSKELSIKKGEEILSRKKADILLCSDTIVEISGHVLGKPKDKNNAREMLKRLSGTEHQVITSIAFFKNQSLDHVIAEVSKVTFRDLSDHDIASYLENARYLDKAGAYGIQEHGQAFATKLDGNFSNVVGLPLNRVLSYLEKTFGPDWRSKFE